MRTSAFRSTWPLDRAGHPQGPDRKRLADDAVRLSDRGLRHQLDVVTRTVSSRRRTALSHTNKLDQGSKQPDFEDAVDGARKHMTYTDIERPALETVRAIRRNDADAMNGIIDEKFIYINGSGKIYERDSYVKAVRTYQLTYSSDLDPSETDHRVDGDLYILVGMMLAPVSMASNRSIPSATCVCGELGKPNGSSWLGSRRCCGTRRPEDDDAFSLREAAFKLADDI